MVCLVDVAVTGVEGEGVVRARKRAHGSGGEGRRVGG